MNRVVIQAEFLLRVCELIQLATRKGFVVTGGELWRPPEMQRLYFNQKMSKTLDSPHLNRLAIDLNFFQDGQLTFDREVLLPLGHYWEAFGEKYRWGGSWRGKIDSGESTFMDTPHFERQV